MVDAPEGTFSAAYVAAHYFGFQLQAEFQNNNQCVCVSEYLL